MKNSKIMQSNPAGIAEAGNTIYRVHVTDSGSGLGLYTATTGPGHPAGPGLNVLYGGGSPWTTFNTIRSYTSGIDYVQKLALSVNPVIVLGPFGTLTSIGQTGFRATYSLPGPEIGASSTPDALTII
ncbi:MAG: hypothetical protein GX295_10655, partial [Syntrophomonadaceae bacterium]|nr:hypothetical protein [Syntrophomonadaceae bacterium]